MSKASEDIKGWLAVRVFYRREKYVRQLLQRKEVECWVPTKTRTRRYKRKVRKVELPLISQYVFVYHSLSNLTPVLSTEGVIEIVRPSGYITPIPEEEIKILKRITGEVREVELKPGQLRKGDAIELIGGELTGMKGVMLEERGKQKVAVNLEGFEHFMLFEVPVDYIRKLL